MKKEKFLTNGWVVAIGAIISCALWGSAFPCIKIGYKLLNIASDNVSTQILFAGVRFTLAGVLSIVFESIKDIICTAWAIHWRRKKLMKELINVVHFTASRINWKTSWC